MRGEELLGLSRYIVAFNFLLVCSSLHLHPHHSFFSSDLSISSHRQFRILFPDHSFTMEDSRVVRGSAEDARVGDNSRDLSIRDEPVARRAGGEITLKESIIPVCLVTVLFFMWGFAYGLLDVLNAHFQVALGISQGQSGGLQAAYASTLHLHAWAFC